MAVIGFIGLGHMGNPMVRNLLKAGHTVNIYDVVPEAMLALQLHGAIPMKTLAELAKRSNIIITMVQTGEQVKKILLGDDGLFANATSNALFIDSSSIDVLTSRELHYIAKEKKFDMLDAPVSGGVTGAEAATLTIMVGGEEQIFERAKPILNLLGKNIIYTGAAGNGQVAKICNNMILGISMIAVSEAFTLGEKLGLEAKKLFDVCSHSSGECWSMTHYSPVPNLIENVPSNRQYQPGFTAKMMLKDLLLSQQAANSVKAITPLGAEATHLYEKFVAQGNAEIDFSAIIKMMNDGD